MAYDRSVVEYYNSIKNYNPLTKEEEIELAKRIQQGDSEALDKLVTANLKFVVTIANRYSTSESVMDLIAQGNIGLIEAAKKFDPDKNYKFITYAVWHIKQHIQAYLANSTNLHINEYIDFNKIKSFISSYQKEHCTEIIPSISLIAEKFGFHENYVKDLLNTQSYLSLDKAFSEDSDNSFLDTIANDTDVSEFVITKDLNKKIRHAINKLDDRLKYIIYKRFGLDDDEMTLEELGAVLNLTRERVRQLEAKAMIKLKNSFTRMNLHELYGRSSNTVIKPPSNRRKLVKEEIK